jgi:hypothetical protein
MRKILAGFAWVVAATTTAVWPTDVNAAATQSQVVTLTCTSSPCPSGPTISGIAVVWPVELGATTGRLGYTANAGVYLPASVAATKSIRIITGSAVVYAGLPGASTHRVLVSLSAGQSANLVGAAAGEVVSVVGTSAFTYELSEAAPPCTDPLTCEVVDAVSVMAVCNLPGCTAAPWTGFSMVVWPSDTAYSQNGRVGDGSRTILSTATGEAVFPYMGSWSEGCHVTAVRGTVLVIEWVRGAESWRETTLSPGQSHTIDLVGSENSSLIEGTTGFQVSLDSCTPQSIGN